MSRYPGLIGSYIYRTKFSELTRTFKVSVISMYWEQLEVM